MINDLSVCSEFIDVFVFFLFVFPAAYSKHVSWLLGRDGDVSVSVIGEVDEFRSSKLLQNIMNNR